MIIFISPNKHW